jgi:hypothetical protein
MKDYIKFLINYNKVSRRAKKTKIKLIKSLSKALEINLLILGEIDVTNERHRNKLPAIIEHIDNIIADTNKLTKNYRDFIE